MKITAIRLASARQTADLVEYIGGSPYRDGITRGGWTIDAQGDARIADARGLGIALDRAQLARFTPGGDQSLNI
jgi:D-galactarolactone cycloisomerase